MKYCPKCGNLLDENNSCTCGFKIEGELPEYNSTLPDPNQFRTGAMNIYNEIDTTNEVNSDILINQFIDKEPYIKVLTDDRIINLTGQSGSGKTTYANNEFNSDEYLIIDTDEIFSENRYNNSTGINKELGKYFRDKYKVLPNCGDDFDLIYKDILDYCSKYNKIIVIDCAQFHCIKDINLLKGKLIVLRTSINTCYKRCIDRFINNNPNYTYEELNKYKEKKKAIFKWYKYTNSFIERIDNNKKVLK